MELWQQVKTEFEQLSSKGNYKPRVMTLYNAGGQVARALGIYTNAKARRMASFCEKFEGTEYATSDGAYLHLHPTTPQAPYLLHKGRLDIAGKSFLETGIWGDENVFSPTYVQTPDGRVDACNSNTTLFISIPRLLERRTIFIDPEAFYHEDGVIFTRSLLGKTFFVMGGIPVEAIADMRHFTDNLKQLTEEDYPRVFGNTVLDHLDYHREHCVRTS